MDANRLADSPCRESDLAPGAARSIEAVVGNAWLFEEIDLRWTAPDLLAAVPFSGGSPPSAPSGSEDVVPNLVSEAFTIAELLEQQGPLDRLLLEEHTSLRWAVFVREVLQPLLERGVIACDGIHWSFRAWPAPIYSEFHTVELKLNDWRGAIVQATRNQLFVDSSWIAMPSDRLSHKCLDAAAEAGVGVIAVSGETGKVAIPARRCTDLHASTRRLIEEHLRDALTRTERRVAGSPMQAGDQRALSRTPRKS